MLPIVSSDTSNRRPIRLPVAAAMSPALLQDGEGVLKALRQNADNGDAEAQFNLGYMYANGTFVPQDNAQGSASPFSSF